MNTTRIVSSVAVISLVLSACVNGSESGTRPLEEEGVVSGDPSTDSGEGVSERAAVGHNEAASGLSDTDPGRSLIEGSGMLEPDLDASLDEDPSGDEPSGGEPSAVEDAESCAFEVANYGLTSRVPPPQSGVPVQTSSGVMLLTRSGLIRPDYWPVSASGGTFSLAGPLEVSETNEGVAVSWVGEDVTGRILLAQDEWMTSPSTRLGESPVVGIVTGMSRRISWRTDSGEVTFDLEQAEDEHLVVSRSVVADGELLVGMTFIEGSERPARWVLLDDDGSVIWRSEGSDGMVQAGLDFYGGLVVLEAEVLLMADGERVAVPGAEVILGSSRGLVWLANGGGSDRLVWRVGVESLDVEQVEVGDSCYIAPVRNLIYEGDWYTISNAAEDSDDWVNPQVDEETPGVETLGLGHVRASRFLDGLVSSLGLRSGPGMHDPYPSAQVFWDGVELSIEAAAVGVDVGPQSPETVVFECGEFSVRLSGPYVRDGPDWVTSAVLGSFVSHVLEDSLGGCELST